MASWTHITTRVAGVGDDGGSVGHMTGLSDLLMLSNNVGGFTLYTSSRAEDGGIGVRDPAAELRLHEEVALTGTELLDAPRRLVSAEINGRTALLVPGLASRKIEGYWQEMDGTLGERFTLELDGPAQSLLTLMPVTVGEKTFFVSTSREVSGLSIWTLDGYVLRPAAGELSVLQQQSNALHATDSVNLSGESYVLALSAEENTLSSYRLQSDGRLTLSSRLGAEEGLAIGAATTLETVWLAGKAYVVIGGYETDSLTVLELGAQGRMTVTDHIIDTPATRLAGLTVLRVLEVEGAVYVVAGGREDGLSVLQLEPGGHLRRVLDIPDSTEMALTNPEALEAQLVQEEGRLVLHLFVAGIADQGPSGMGLTQLRVDLGTPGEVVRASGTRQTWRGNIGNDRLLGGVGDDALEGGDGDDILMDGGGRDTLHGGAGADVFVLTPDGNRDYIRDFEPGVDRIDLSAYNVRSVAQLSILTRAAYCEIRVDGEALRIYCADGPPLTKANLRDEDFFGLKHFKSEPFRAAPSYFSGSESADHLTGWSGNDTLIGASGADTLQGRGGDDVLSGAHLDEAFDARTAKVFRLYRATLDREPDLAGLHGWSGRLAAGEMSLSEVARGFVRSAEFKRTYGATSDAEFVTLLYRNVLGRDPDPAGYRIWTGALESGVKTRAEVVSGFARSAEFRAATETSMKIWTRGLGRDDLIDGGAGRNELYGGILADEFVFIAGRQESTAVLGLEGCDWISLSGFGYECVEDVYDHIEIVGTDLIFDDKGVRITFVDTPLASLQDDMFIF